MPFQACFNWLDDTKKKQPFQVAFFAVVRSPIFERFVLCKSPKSERFVPMAAKIWICGLYMLEEVRLRIICFPT